MLIIIFLNRVQVDFDIQNVASNRIGILSFIWNLHFNNLTTTLRILQALDLDTILH